MHCVDYENEVYFLLLLSRKGFHLFVQATKQQAVWLSLNCINRKYLWALTTPTTFEKSDQAFIIALWSIPLNHNLLLLPQHLEQNLYKKPGNYGVSHELSEIIKNLGQAFLKACGFGQHP